MRDLIHRLSPVLAFALAACGRGAPADPAPRLPTARAAPSERATAASEPVARDTSDAAFRALEADLRARIERAAPAEVAVVVTDLESGRRLGIGEHVRMHAASTMKVPVMLEVFRQAAAGRFSLSDSIVVHDTFASIADGSSYRLSPESDSEQALYELVGERTSVRGLVRRMIVRSSNLATNIVIERVTADSVMRTLRAFGADSMRVLRGVEDIPAYRRGMSNTTTADGLARTLEAIARCDFGRRIALAPAACDEMVGILSAQHFNEMIPAGLPAGVTVAHKTGWITEIHHDGAIVDPPGRAPYVLVVMTRGIADTEASARLAADLSRRVWRTLVGAGADHAHIRYDSTSAALAALHGRHRVAAIEEREFTHAELWAALGPIVDDAAGISREEVGRSAQGRPLHLVRYGRGPTRVLLWSQMHGDESTATMALVDIFRFLADEPDHPLARRLAERLTVLAIPMLNPDGAERFQRRNALGIDVNRDARALSTPEARALKAVRDRFRPEFGFNLHDQNVRTRVGDAERTAAIALLAPAFNYARDDNEVRTRAKHVAAVVRGAVEPLVGGHVTRYGDAFNARAFGDLMQRWGTSTVLIESGGWADDPEKQHLRKTNFVAILSALDAIATGEYATAPVAMYETLPPNGRSADDLLVRGGTIVVPGLEPYRADLVVNYARPLEWRDGTIEDVGDLREYVARDTLDATGLFVHLAPEAVDRRGGRPSLRRGAPASFTIRETADPAGEAVYVVEEGVVRRVDAAAVR